MSTEFEVLETLGFQDKVRPHLPFLEGYIAAAMTYGHSSDPNDFAPLNGVDEWLWRLMFASMDMSDEEASPEFIQAANMIKGLAIGYAGVVSEFELYERLDTGLLGREAT